jgi:hypothetical protein
MNANLVLHCGASAVERSVLEALITPESTDTWQPVPHIKLVETVEHVLADHGLTVTNQAHGITHDGARYFGLMEIHNGHDNPEYCRVLGLRNSHDKRLPAGLVMGSSVFVCDNLAFSGEITISRKHTVFILRDMPSLIDSTVERIVGAWETQDVRIERYREARLNSRDAHDLVIKALDSGVICASRIPQVVHEWREPRHEAFRPRTVWSWFNSVTECLKDNLPLLPKRTQALHEVCDKYVGFNRN